MNDDRSYESKRLYRSDNAILFGVCGGLAEYFDLPPWGVRVVWILLCLTGVGMPLMLILYIVLAMALKRRPAPWGPTAAAPRPDPFYAPPGRASHAAMLAHLQERFEALDRRLQHMESIVTRPDFGLEQKYRDL